MSTSTCITSILNVFRFPFFCSVHRHHPIIGWWVPESRGFDINHETINPHAASAPPKPHNDDHNRELHSTASMEACADNKEDCHQVMENNQPRTVVDSREF
jgi:hypothetical protein